jgi:hypothetical protein
MFLRSSSVLCMVMLVGGLLPEGVASADIIRFFSQSRPGHSDRTGGWSVSVDNGFDQYDAGIDGLVDTPTTDSNFFVPIFYMGGALPWISTRIPTRTSGIATR